MSQHYFDTQYQGRPATVLMGWDRPLSGFFLVVEENTETDEPLIYSNLLDDDLRQLHGTSLPGYLEYFRKILDGLGIQLPEDIFTNVLNDSKMNAGNKISNYWFENGQLNCTTRG